MVHKGMSTWCLRAWQHVGLNDVVEHRYLSMCGLHLIGWVDGSVYIHNFQASSYGTNSQPRIYQ